MHVGMEPKVRDERAQTFVDLLMNARGFDGARVTLDKGTLSERTVELTVDFGVRRHGLFWNIGIDDRTG